MKLEVHKNGVKLFFITFAVMGRRQILSRLIDEQSRPELLPLGEVVKSGLLAIHQVWSAVGVSDYVIMPDHVHFLMVVDFLRAPSFNPLWATHRLLDAIEQGWDHRGLAPAPPKANSGLVTQPRNGNPALNSALAAAESVANIDMITELKAAVARGREMAAALKFGESSASEASSVAQAGCGAASGASSVVQAGCGAASGASSVAQAGRVAASGASSVVQAGCGAASPEVPVIFERSPWLDLAFDPRQLKAIRQYIRLNPARALWKLKHPDLFVCHRGLKTARLSRFSNQRFDGVGNLALLGSPFLFHVRLTLKKTLEEHQPAIDEIIDKARHGWVPVSGFISPGEREVLKRLKTESTTRFIRLLPYTLADRYDPSAEDSREIAAGRLAIISPFAATSAISSLEMRSSSAAAHAFRANCLLMNDIGAKLCESICD